MDELNCDKCLFYELDGDELPCRICTLEKDFFRPDPKKMKKPDAPQEDEDDDADSSSEAESSDVEHAPSAPPVHRVFIKTKNLHVHFHMCGPDTCSA